MQHFCCLTTDKLKMWLQAINELDINFEIILQEMEHPFKEVVQLSKEQKLKKMSQKLNGMMNKKNIDISQANQLVKKQQKPQNTVAKKKDLGEQKGEEQDKGKTIEKSGKSKIIKKEEHKPSKTYRKAAGQVWVDKTMQDWPDNDYRVHCGNLGNQVNDQILASVFRRYPSFQMARVIRDRRTGKTKGYGFLSFSKPNDFLSCLKQMNGKHVGNRPVKLTKSTHQDRDLHSHKNEQLPSDFKKNAQKTTHQICLDYKYVSSL